MSFKDKALRPTAIPYYANVWGYNRGQFSDQNISSANDIGDLSALVPSSYSYSTSISAVNAIRVLQPQYGDIIEANLNLAFQMRSTEGERQFRIAIGTFDGLYDRETSYSESYIAASFAKITGRNEPYTIAPGNSFSFARLNLAKGLYHRGDSDYRADAFVVLLVWDQAPSKAGDYAFTKFDVECTMQMGLQ